MCMWIQRRKAMHQHETKDFTGKFGVITCSSTRTQEDDDSGKTIMDLLENSGHEVVSYEVIRDDEKLIRKTVLDFLEDCDAVVISGGTGLTKHDVTVQAVSSISEYEMTGFSHLFAMLSFQEIGSNAALSRATAFVVERKPVFCLPGSPAGASLGVSRIILEQISHIHHELNR